MKYIISIEVHFVGYLYTVELHFSWRRLSGSSVIRIGLALPICREFYKTNLAWNCRLSDQVQYRVMASGTSYQAWSRVLYV